MTDADSMIDFKKCLDRLMAHIEVSISLYPDQAKVDFSDLIKEIEKVQDQIRDQHRVAGVKFANDMKQRMAYVHERVAELASQGIYFEDYLEEEYKNKKDS